MLSRKEANNLGIDIRKFDEIHDFLHSDLSVIKNCFSEMKLEKKGASFAITFNNKAPIVVMHTNCAEAAYLYNLLGYYINI